MAETGAETLYETFVDRPAVNAGVSVILETSGARVDPFYLGARDENTVQGFAGTPVNVNALTYGYLSPVGAAGAAFPRQQRFFVAVDSGRDRFSGANLAGRYVLRSWIDDVSPPGIQMLTTRVAAGRPALVALVRDSQSGVDPSSLTIGYQGVLVGASSYDPSTGVAVFVLPASAPALVGRALDLRLVASDFQEAKNIDTVGPSLMPNTRSAKVRLHVVEGTVVEWVLPAPEACLDRKPELAVAVSSTRAVTGVRFTLDGRQIAVAQHAHGLWLAQPSLGKTAAGRHTLVAVATGAARGSVSARRIVRMCPR